MDSDDPFVHDSLSIGENAAQKDFYPDIRLALKISQQTRRAQHGST